MDKEPDQREAWKLPLSFPDWQRVLFSGQLPLRAKRSHDLQIKRFLGHCRGLRTPATVILARSYIQDLEKQGDTQLVREALRWFFRKGLERKRLYSESTSTASTQSEHRTGFGESGNPPPPAACDLGNTPWEKQLIRACRRKNHLWRTERSYRGWAQRMVRFVAPRAPETIDADDVGRFLTDLATRGRLTWSTQRQALNAIVFFLREGLGREPGEIDFKRIPKKIRAPDVLTQRECSLLIEELDGALRLVTGIMYRIGPKVERSPTTAHQGS